MAAPACIVCHQEVSSDNPPWILLCQHLLCGRCVSAKQYQELECPIDREVTPHQELLLNDVLLHQLSRLDPSLPSPSHLHLLYKPPPPYIIPCSSCEHERFGAFPCCLKCGAVLEELLEVQDWKCPHCHSVNAARMIVCNFCSKTNQGQKMKLEKMKKKSGRK